MMAEKRFIADPSPWSPITDPRALKVLGKFAEELGECVEACVDLTGRRPASYLDGLTKEVADVLCNVDLVDEFLALNLPVFHGKLSSRFVISELTRALGACTAATARCIIQGVDEAEPSTGRPNRDWLIEAIVDVRRCCAAAIGDLLLDASAIESRMTFKRSHLTRWHKMEANA